MAVRKKTQKQVAEGLKASANKIWLAGLGALSTAEEEGGKLFKSLVKRGEAFESKGKVKLDKLRGQVAEIASTAKERAEGAWEKVEDKWGVVEDQWDHKVVGALKRVGVPSKDEIAALTRRVEELTHMVERKVKPGRRPAARKAATRKTAKRRMG